jgi:hypothetical protein
MGVNVDSGGEAFDWEAAGHIRVLLALEEGVSA